MAEDQTDDALKSAKSIAGAFEAAEAMVTEGKSADEVQKALEEKWYDQRVAKRVVEYSV